MRGHTRRGRRDSLGSGLTGKETNGDTRDEREHAWPGLEVDDTADVLERAGSASTDAHDKQPSLVKEVRTFASSPNKLVHITMVHDGEYY